jgi:hypothetical protein
MTIAQGSLTFIFFLLLNSCAHKSKINLPNKPYLNDKVSVQTVLMQTHAAYLRGCMEGHKAHDSKKKWFPLCKQQADSYLEKDVISILNQ